MRDSIFAAFAEFSGQKKSISKTLEPTAPTVFNAALPPEAQSSVSILRNLTTYTEELGPATSLPGMPISTNNSPYQQDRCSGHLPTVFDERTLKPSDFRNAVQEARCKGFAESMDARLLPQRAQVKRSIDLFWPSVILAGLVLGLVGSAGLRWLQRPGTVESGGDVTAARTSIDRSQLGSKGRQALRFPAKKNQNVRQRYNIAQMMPESPLPTEAVFTASPSTSELSDTSSRESIAFSTFPSCGPYSWRCDDITTSSASRLPARLTFGLRLDLSLSEPASTLGGPVAAITTADVQDPESRLMIPSGTVVLFVTATNNPSGRVAIDWTKPARLLLADDQTISLRGYLVAEDGSIDLPAVPLEGERGSGESKRLAQRFLGMGGQYARKRNTIVGDLVNSVYREISEPVYHLAETPILVTPPGTRFSLTVQ